ncbi:WD40-repeat-containing domain protein [Blastocladiella britannica]|nr:WD40-repeat-containing domain protein [Blastocladiella britannica]
MSDNGPYRMVALTPEAHAGPVNAAQFDSAGNYVLTGGADKLLRLWNARDQRLVMTLSGHGWEVLDVAISPDNTRLASCGKDRGVLMWDVSAAAMTRKITGHTERINTVAFNSNGTVVASGSYDTSVRLWDLKSNGNKPIQILTDAKDSVTSVTIRDHLVVSGSVDGCVRVYDLRAGSKSTDSIGSPITCVALSNDDQCMLVHGTAGVPLRLLDVATGDDLNAYVGAVNGDLRLPATLDHRDALVLAGSEDGRALVWDLAGDRGAGPVQSLDGHTGAVVGLATSPVAAACVTGGADGSMRWWWGIDD